MDTFFKQNYEDVLRKDQLLSSCKKKIGRDPFRAKEEKHKKGASDRFIPRRTTAQLDFSHCLDQENQAPNQIDKLIVDQLLGGDQRVLFNKQPRPDTRPQQSVPRRVLPDMQEKVLDAPELMDDFTLNVVDWQQHNGVIAIGLTGRLYVWNYYSQQIQELLHIPETEQFISAIRWNSPGSMVVAYSNGQLQMLDLSKQALEEVQSTAGNQVCSIENTGEQTYVTGTQNGQIGLYDRRVPHLTAMLQGHTYDICNIKYQENMLLTAGLDKEVKIFDVRRMRGQQQQALVTIQQKTGVRAIDWSEGNRHSVITGGGETDRMLRVYRTNSHRPEVVSSAPTDGQVCSVVQSRGDILLGVGSGANQVVAYGYHSPHNYYSTHGTLSRLGEMNNHFQRVLYLAMSPEKDVLLSASPDENLSFWRLSAKRQPCSEHKSALWDAAYQMR